MKHMNASMVRAWMFPITAKVHSFLPSFLPSFGWSSLNALGVVKTYLMYGAVP